MPAVNIFLSHRRFASAEELTQFALTSNGSEARFIHEVGFIQFDPADIKTIFKPDAESIYYLLDGAPDFNLWGRKVRFMPGVYDTAILVYEPSKMSTPEASSLYYVGRLVYEYPA